MPRVVLNAPALVAAVVGVMVFTPAALLVYRRARGLEPRRLDQADIFTGIAAGLVVSFAVQLAAAVAEVCFATIDMAYLVRGLRPGWAFGISAPVQRGGLGPEIAAFLPLAGLSAARWGLVILAVHLLNAGLVFALARALSVERRWAGVAALVFVAVPGLADNAFNPSNLTELLVQTAFLLVTLGYLRRARALTRAGAWPWLVIEVLGVVVGVGNKESFIVYPALLVAYELTIGIAERAPSWRSHARAVALRLLPHALLWTWTVYALLPMVCSREAHPFNLDFSPGSMLRQLARSSTEMVTPWLRDRGGSASMPWGGLVVPLLLFFRLRRGGPPLRFLLLFALVVAAPVAVLGKRFDGVYGYHLWSAFTIALALGLPSMCTTWLRWPSYLWLVLLAVLWGGGPATRRDCAVPPAAAAAAARLPVEVCAQPTPTWSVPRTVIAEHLALWRRQAAVPSNFIPGPERRCLMDRALDDEQCWKCLGGDSPRAAPHGDTSSPVELLRQLVAARCRRLDVRVELL